MPSTKKEIILSYLKANPLMGASELTDVIRADYPGFYGSRKSLRSEINRLRSEGKAVKPKLTFIDTDKPVNDNPFGLPAAFDLDYEPYHIPAGLQKVLILSDTHLPYHDISAITAALNYGKHRGADTILLNGDICDIYQASRFCKDPAMPPIKSEVDAARTFFAALRKYFKDAHIIYKLGNHDERFMVNLLGKAPEYAQIDGFSLPEVLHCSRYGIEPIEDKRIVKAGKLPIYHGHEFAGGGSGGVNPARALFLKIYTNGAEGHFHRTSEHASKRGDGKLVTCWSTGCLCQLYPDYARNNQWNHGFAFVEIDGEEFEMENKRIYNGNVY